jgi:serine/threonine protein phosphatase 1
MSLFLWSSLLLHTFSTFWNYIKGLFVTHRLETVNINLDETDYYVADNVCVYVIGDIHGCSHLLEKTIEKMVAHSENQHDKKLYFVALGDYVDRGKNSKKVIDILIHDIPENFEKIFIKGNHEVYMMNFMVAPMQNELWLDYGGRETLESYDVTLPNLTETELKRAADELSKNMPQAHHEFFNNLKLYHIMNDYLFVHAGLDPYISLEKQSELCLTTIRSKFINYSGHFQGLRVVHGHTPVDKPDITPHRINLDTGAYMTDNLTCAVIEHNKVRIL